MPPEKTGATVRLTPRGVTTRAAKVPLTFALGTSADVVRAGPLLLIDVQMEEGQTGRAYLFCYTASGARAIADHIREAIGLVAGAPATPSELGQRLNRRFALLGVTGTVRMALSAIDMALWDALAQTLEQPLCVVLGGAPQALPAYDSRGLGLIAPERLAEEAEQLMAGGLKALKLRLGYPTLAEDMTALEAVRGRVGSHVQIMVDYNQALTPAEAHARGRALDDHGLVWIEEPIRHDDYECYALIARDLRTPVQIGENFNGPEAMLQALSARACDFVMPDVARIGGVTGWMRATGIAAAASLAISSHLMPEISAHLLSATPRAHWLEYVDWADAILQEPMRLVDGAAITSDRPGTGIVWDEKRLQRLETL
jgi:mandelate racemase